ncbi:hypothetical protein H0H87_010079 [Tephrocybe sp. NHM501043]|nr:hypothetical protein H0H87_010079 [Tephrocybe sp. NHM501043]
MHHNAYYCTHPGRAMEGKFEAAKLAAQTAHAAKDDKGKDKMSDGKSKSVMQFKKDSKVYLIDNTAITKLSTLSDASTDIAGLMNNTPCAEDISTDLDAVKWSSFMAIVEKEEIET